MNNDVLCWLAEFLLIKYPFLFLDCSKNSQRKRFLEISYKEFPEVPISFCRHAMNIFKNRCLGYGNNCIVSIVSFLELTDICETEMKK